jgi:hypothetical protein
MSTKFVQIKALGLKLALPEGEAYIQVSDLRAIMALLFEIAQFCASCKTSLRQGSLVTLLQILLKST